jgi:hypothetical protein
MLTTNLTNLISRAFNAGFRFSIGDADRAADYLRKERAAREVTIPATLDGQKVGFTIGLVEHRGYYSKIAKA